MKTREFLSKIHFLIWIFLALAIGLGVAFFSLEGARFASRSFQGAGEAMYDRALLAASYFSTEEDVPELLQVKQEAKAIWVNLDDMKLGLYENGKRRGLYTILAKAKEESLWEASPGKYSVLAKKESHVSAFSKTTLPYSVHFGYNFLIHGTGSLSKSKSPEVGIRLSDSNAKKVYSFAASGVPIFIYSAKETAATEPVISRSYALLDSKKAAPRLLARAYLVADLDTGEIILEKNISTAYPIASLTKLMTALISLELIPQSEVATVSKEAKATYGETGDLKKGEKIEIRNLLYPLLLESSNDAAEVLAEHYGRNKFLNQMNNRAEAMGLAATRFVDASGLDNLNMSSARDLFVLARQIFNNNRVIFETTKKDKQQVPGHRWVNNNSLSKLPDYLGGKNGFTTEAVYTYVTVFSLPLTEIESRNVAFIVLGSPQKQQDVTRLLTYVKQNIYYAGKSRISKAPSAAPANVLTSFEVK